MRLAKQNGCQNSGGRRHHADIYPSCLIVPAQLCKLMATVVSHRKLRSLENTQMVIRLRFTAAVTEF